MVAAAEGTAVPLEVRSRDQGDPCGGSVPGAPAKIAGANLRSLVFWVWINALFLGLSGTLVSSRYFGVCRRL